MKTLEQLIKKSDYYYVNPNITSENFPKPKKIATTRAKIIKINKPSSSQEVLDEIKRQGYRPANIWELAEWANKHREEMDKVTWMIVLGQTWVDSGGNHGVPYVGAYSDGDFRFDLARFEDGWSDDLCLLCFCDNNLDTLKIGNELDSLTLPDELIINNIIYIKK